MRKLMWFSLGFGGACALGAYLYTPWLAAAVLLGLLCFAASLILRKRLGSFRPAVAVCLGFALGLCWFLGFHGLYLQPAGNRDGTEQNLTAEVTNYSTPTVYGIAVDARIRLENRSYQAVLYLKDDTQLKPGDTVKGLFRLRLTYEGQQADTYHKGNGVFLLAYAQNECQVTQAQRTPMRYFAATMSHQITQRLESTFPEDVAFFTKALLLGDRSDVDYETNTAFKVSGISHIIAVSGLHVSILFAVVLLLSGRQRYLTAILGIPVLLLFAAVAGFTPSITRACVMQLIMIIAMLTNREYDPPTSLSAAALLMLVINPLVITSVSFQLSVGCMAGIFLFSGGLQTWLCSFRFWGNWKGKGIKVRLRNWFTSGVAVTLSSMFFTTPLVVCYFGCISLVSVVTNLLTLWAVSWIFYGIVAVCLLSLIWQQGAVLLAWLVSWLIRYVLTAAKLLSAIPLSAVYTKSIFILIWIIFCYVLLAVLLISRKKKPLLSVSLAVLGLCAALLCSWLEPFVTGRLMTVLDVGQGQSIILQSQGRTFLVDCGGDRDSVAADQAAETLLSMGIYRLDGLILTHYDADHAGGLLYLLSRIPADTVFLPEESDDEAVQQQILMSAGDSAFFVREDISLAWADTELTVFAPAKAASDNERSLCVLFREENCAILITGDLSIKGENRLLQEKDIPKLTCLVAGHHGSGFSTGDAILAATQPEKVFISVGTGNPYGHPHQALLERLRQYECRVYRTDLEGSIVFRRDRFGKTE